MKAVIIRVVPPSERLATVLNNLRKKRRQSAFTIMALDHFLRSEEGMTIYCSMAGVDGIEVKKQQQDEEGEGVSLESFFKKK